MDGPLVDGMVLAATAVGDRGGREAAAGLAADLARALEERLAALAAADPSQRRAEVRRLAARLGAVSPRATPAGRVAAILATEVPREVGRRWASGAPPVRRGFRVSRSLKATLRRLVREDELEASRAELRAARELEAEDPAESEFWRAWARRLAAGDSVTRASGALWLGARSGGDAPDAALGGDSDSHAWRLLGRELATARDAARDAARNEATWRA